MEGAAPALLSRFWVQDLVRDAGYGPLSIGDTIRTLPYRIPVRDDFVVNDSVRVILCVCLACVCAFFLCVLECMFGSGWRVTMTKKCVHSVCSLSALFFGRLCVHSCAVLEFLHRAGRKGGWRSPSTWG